MCAHRCVLELQAKQACVAHDAKLLGLMYSLFWRADPPLKEPVAARGNILSAAAADRAMPGGSAAPAALPHGRATDARPAPAQPAKSGAGPAHVGLHVSTPSLAQTRLCVMTVFKQVWTFAA